MMKQEVPPVFTDSCEEIAYWRAKAEEYRLQAQNTKEELDEFQEGSRELEAELEAQLEQVEIKNKELKSLTNRLQMENEEIKDKLEQCNREYHFQINELQSELSEIKGIKDKLAKYVRELEQQNDDLERAKRSTLASLEDFELRMNVAIERNAFLESELDEKEQLKTVVQRLKDETRDLRSELRVLNPQFEHEEEPDNDRVMELSLTAAASGAGASSDNPDGAEKQVSCEKTNGETPSKRGGGGNLPNSPPLTPSARISALGIVGDLLRKVGALELKLVSCRNIVKENGKDGGREFSNINSMDRKGRIPRGASSPAVKNLCDNGS
eukprot:TRINITY_DN21792_c0_g1_i12.p1 TRINITY_DN21792_c0_g1~~TRINITY_DN21792_c0_g1_i12.p1  ORF type:complete len:325 (-),score=101.41 TRINITY_DN21792_c0_g1_i12:617-1591(-)